MEKAPIITKMDRSFSQAFGKEEYSTADTGFYQADSPSPLESSFLIYQKL